MYTTMLAKHFFTKRYVRRSLALVVSLLVLLCFTSCNCQNPSQKPPNKPSPPDQAIEYGTLTMRVTPTCLVGDEKITKAIFILADSNKPADGTAYKLRISFSEIGGKGSSLNYIDSTQAARVINSSLQESLIHFFDTSLLKGNASPRQISFTLVPGPSVSSMEINFELLDQTSTVLQAYTANWKKEPEAVKLRLSNLIYTPSPGNASSITCQIQNSGKEIAHDVQLRYTNISEGEPDQSVLLNNKQTDVISCGNINGKNTIIDQTLFLNFKSTTKAKFKFELLYQGNLIAEATKEQEFSINIPS